jgi:hypothetical protein
MKSTLAILLSLAALPVFAHPTGAIHHHLDASTSSLSAGPVLMGLGLICLASLTALLRRPAKVRS